MFRKLTLPAVILTATLGLAGCGGSDNATSPMQPPIPPLPVQVLGNTVALAPGNVMISFNRATPQTITSTSPAVAGLQSGETLLGIDYRPANGVLFGLGSSGALYQIDPLTGVATNRLVLTNNAAGNAPIVLSGTSFGVDFNPQADRLRIVSNTGQNLRINVSAAVGNTFVDTPVPATAAVSGSGYTNSFPGAANTRLLSINLATNTLDEQGTLNPATGFTQPNDGTQVVIAPLGIAPTAANGFDIDARTNQGVAAFTVGTTNALYTINLAPAAGANAATLVGPIGDGTRTISGLALVPVAAPTVVGLTSSNQLVTFSLTAPNTLITNVPITGLNPMEQMLGVDFRPQDGMLWGLTNAGRLFTIVPTTGVATFRVALSSATATAALATAVTASVDFNPVANRLRVITPAGLSLRIAVVDFPATATAAAIAAGTTFTDANINRVGGAPTSVLAASYTNNFAGGPSTQLFDIDSAAGFLALQNPPNDGTLVNIGTAGLGVSIANLIGFDIAGGGNGLILGAVRANDTGPFMLRVINLTSGAIGVYNPVSTGPVPSDAQSAIGGANGPVLRDIAISPL